MIARRWRVLLLLLILGFAPGGQAAPGANVWLLSVDDAIGPASADYLLRGLDQAQAQGAQLVVIRLDTPGGLDSAMRQIIKAILASTLPVATYVAPGGARAASAGTYILYASHVAAMAPGTNLVAADLPDLLRQLDGRTLTVAGQPASLQTAGANVVEHLPDWRTRLLAVITNPSVALILIMIGVYGLLFEFMNPGSGVGGVVGGICLLLALYALQLLPVSHAGVALILLGVAFMVAEAFLPSFGVIGFGGIVAFVVGAVILMDTDAPGFGIPLTLIVSLAVLSALLLGGVLGMALKARRRALVSGDAGLVGSLVTVTQVRADNPFCGSVQAQGEQWQAQCATPLQPGQHVRVTARHGVTLEVSATAPTAQGE